LSPATEEKMRTAFTKQVELENAIKDVIGNAGVPTYMNISYLNFSREIAGLHRHYSGDELNQRLESVMAKWLERKLDKTILGKNKKSRAWTPCF